MMRLSLSNPEYFRGLHVSSKQSGFSLIEMAVVLVILGFILGGVIGPLSTQRDLQKRNETQKQLEEIRNALIGYVQINGRLPCPASSTSSGRADPVSGACNTAYSFVPYADLGIRGSISGGVLIDSWQQPVRYRVTSVNSWFYTTTTSIGFSPLPPLPDFRICAALPCTAASITSTEVVYILFSTGDTDSASVNSGATTDFLNNIPSASFDDLVVWTSRPELLFAISKTR
jgi:prepilin-type N-terminal cleavage/methylation domain-containing protein